jgi:sulfite exporter TauE/SafE
MLSAFSLGLAGAGHCLGMCGGIAAAMNLGGNATTVTTLSYHAGRILSYTALGGALGYASSSIDIASWTLFLRYLAGILLVFMGLYVGNWWRGMAILERAGARLWQPVQKLYLYPAITASTR